MKILHVIRNVEVGGMERMALTLAAEQVRQGHVVRIAEVEPSQGSRLPVPDDVKVVTRVGLWRQVLWAGVVHAHNLVALRAAWLPTRLFIRRLVFTKHGEHFPPGFSRWLLARPDAMVAVSQPVYERYLQLLPQVHKRLRYVPNGVGGAVGSGEWGVESGKVNEDYPPSTVHRPLSTFLWVGRMVREKGLDVLLQAWAAAKLEHAQLVLVGDGPERIALEKAADQMDIRESVHFAGMQQHVESYYASAHVFVMPSRTEGLPMALLEAGMAGVPVIVSNVGAMPGIVHASQGGWLVPSDDVAALTGALARAGNLTPADLQDRGRLLRAHVLAIYSVEKMTRDYAAIYAGVLGVTA